MAKTALQKNLSLMNIYAFLQFYGITSLWVIYLSVYKGLSLVEVGLLESVFHITSFVFEVPSGALADRFGYRKVLAAGKISSLISAGLMLAGEDFPSFAIAFIFSALSYNCNSGSYEALVYESMKETGEESGYLKRIAHINVLIEIAAQAGVISAGLLADLYFPSVYWVSILLSLVNLIVILLLQEPVRLQQKEEWGAEISTTYLAILSGAAEVLRKKKELARWIGFFAVLDSFAATYYFYFQNYLTRMDYSGTHISFFLLAASLFAILGAKVSPQIEKQLSRSWIPVVFSLTVVVFLLLSTAREGVLLFAGFSLSAVFSAVSPTIASYYINQYIPSRERATLLSVNSMCYSLVMILLFPAVGKVIEQFQFRRAFLMMAGTVILLMVLAGIQYAAVTAKQNPPFEE